MIFAAVYRPTALFSLRDSNSTSSGAKSLFLPSPYAIKMALLNQAISLGGIDFDTDSLLFYAIRDLKISYRISGSFCVNNCFVKIQKQREKEPFKPTVSFREYVFLDSDLELIFETNSVRESLFDTNDDITAFLKRYLCTINQFGKRGCFFQFVEFRDNPSQENVVPFKVENIQCGGILQEYDDFGEKVTFEKVNSYTCSKTERSKKVLFLPLQKVSSSKSFTLYKVSG